jgi:hypothetical protein
MKRVYLGSNIVWQNAPTAIAATGVGTTSFTANWEAYSGATYYLLDVSETSDFSTFVYQNEIVLAPNTSYVVIGVQSNTTYYYRVRASDGDLDYLNIINYATTQGYTLPSEPQQALQEQLLVDLKNAGVWSKLDTFAVFATDGDSDFALIDWKRVTNYTAVNSPDFTPNGGFTGDGLAAYIDTNFNPATSGVNYTLNDAGRYFWVDNRIGGIWEGATSAGNSISDNGSSVAKRINHIGSLNDTVNFAVDEFHAINRTSSTNVELFTNTTQFSRTKDVFGIIDSVQWVLRNASTYNGSRFRFYGMGASIVSENNDFYNAMNTYFTSL